MEETDGKFVVVTRGAHRRSDERAIELNRQRLLDDQLVWASLITGWSMSLDEDTVGSSTLTAIVHWPQA
jgi:hypothetical protein